MYLRCAQTEEALLEAFGTVKRAFVTNGTAVSIAQVAAVAGAKRKKDPVIWTATVAQAFGQLLQDVKHGAGSGEGKA